MSKELIEVLGEVEDIVSQDYEFTHNLVKTLDAQIAYTKDEHIRAGTYSELEYYDAALSISSEADEGLIKCIFDMLKKSVSEEETVNE